MGSYIPCTPTSYLPPLLLSSFFSLSLRLSIQVCFLFFFVAITQKEASGRHSIRPFPQTERIAQAKGPRSTLPTVRHASFPGFHAAGSRRDMTWCIISIFGRLMIQDSRERGRIAGLQPSCSACHFPPFFSFYFFSLVSP